MSQGSAMLSPTKHFLRAWLAIPRRAAQKERRKTSGIISANALRPGATWTIKIAAIKIAAIKITRTRSNRDIDHRRAPVPHDAPKERDAPSALLNRSKGTPIAA